MKRQKCEPLEITPLHKPQLSLWLVILISLAFAWPLGACGKDEEGKKSESRVRCWWMSPETKSRVPYEMPPPWRSQVSFEGEGSVGYKATSLLLLLRADPDTSTSGSALLTHVTLLLLGVLALTALPLWLWPLSPSRFPGAAALHRLEWGKFS